jgi:predicted RNase H-like nuclease
MLRQELRPGRTSSVFNAPFLSALATSSYMEANDLAKQHAVIGRSKQSWYLLPKIREVRHEYRSEMIESHPVVCFARLSGHPARFSKKTKEGIAEPIELPEQYDCPPVWE